MIVVKLMSQEGRMVFPVNIDVSYVLLFITGAIWARWIYKRSGVCARPYCVCVCVLSLIHI